MPLVISPRALKDLKGLPVSDRNAILAKIEVYAASGRGDVKKLVGTKELFRLRHGSWRAIFEQKGAVILLRVLHRREAYD